MFAFPGMLVNAAEQAGMSFPPDADHFKPDVYPHFQVFCNAQLGRSFSSVEVVFVNAKIVAEIPEEDIRSTTFEHLRKNGFNFGD